MTKRIFRSIFAVAAAVLLTCLVVIMGLLYEYFRSVQRGQLEAQTALAARGVADEGLAYLEGLDAGSYRLTWIASDGRVLYDSMTDASVMENHAGREEVREALDTGFGESERYSDTVSEKTLYRAQRLPDGTVIRVSATLYSVLTLVFGMLQFVVIIIAAALVLSALLAGRLSRRIVAPLNELDLDKPLDNDSYEELSPLLTRIERQHRQIVSQLNELRRKSDEFSAVTASMSEGLVLLSERGVILSINRAAARLFGAGEDCVGRDMLTVDRSLPIQELVRAALSGRHDETVTERNGGRFQLNASPVFSEGKMAGAVILSFDVTEKAMAEQRRREFSANVSHELKTPLQSVMGSAELIENGLVKQEDMPRFIGHIRAEASRLVALIDDIIRLSQLDEGGDMQKEEVDLLSVAREAADALSPRAKANGVALRVQGESVPVSGVRRLLYEIAYNLCDNAVKYNVANGRVDVRVSRDASGATLSVTDTGIGIPAEHHGRIFERFYRVDKSHSKETGGTGLGLSIVKHAAQVHGAVIDLTSKPGKGTSVSVRFPLS